MIDTIHLQKAAFFEKYQVYDCCYQIRCNGKTYQGHYSNDIGWELEADTPDYAEEDLEEILAWLWNNYQWDKIEHDLDNVFVEIVSESAQSNTEVNKLISMLNKNLSSDLKNILRQTLQNKHGIDLTSEE